MHRSCKSLLFLSYTVTPFTRSYLPINLDNKYRSRVYKVNTELVKNENVNWIADKTMAKSHVFLLMQICYPYIVWNTDPKFHENQAQLRTYIPFSIYYKIFHIKFIIIVF